MNVFGKAVLLYSIGRSITGRYSPPHKGGPMRKTILAVLSSIMTISLCACSASGTAAASASASASESGKASPAATAAEEMVEVTIPFSMMDAEDDEDGTASVSPEDYCAKITKERKTKKFQLRRKINSKNSTITTAN